MISLRNIYLLLMALLLAYLLSSCSRYESAYVSPAAKNVQGVPSQNNSDEWKDDQRHKGELYDEDGFKSEDINLIG